VANVASSDPSRYYLYTPELQLLAETEQSTSASKAITNSYLWFAGLPVASIDSSGTTRWYGTDHLGTPFLQTDASGAVAWRAEYTPYGDIFTIRSGASLHQPLRQPGQVAQDGSNLYNNVFRWYQSGWGRYTQVDPIALSGGTNLYAYVGDDPVLKVDALGLLPSQQPWPSTHKRACDMDDWSECQSKCGNRPVDGCLRVWVPKLRGMKPLMRWDFVKGPLECNCREDCPEKSREWLDKVEKFFNDLIPVLPLLGTPKPAPLPVPLPASPVFPVIINPCLLNPSLCYGTGSGT
jgi:RHS repeat-associated protein